MARLFADENVPRPVVLELRALGHDVLTTDEAGLAGRATPDAAILGFATADGRAVVTLNRRHFVRLHVEQPDHAGIVACTVDQDFLALAHRIHSAIGERATLSGCLLRVHRTGDVF